MRSEDATLAADGEGGAGEEHREVSQDPPVHGRSAGSTCVLRVTLFFPKWGGSRGSAVCSTWSAAETESWRTVALCGRRPSGNMVTVSSHPSGKLVVLVGIMASMASTSCRRSAQHWAIPPSWWTAVGGTLQECLHAQQEGRKQEEAGGRRGMSGGTRKDEEAHSISGRHGDQRREAGGRRKGHLAGSLTIFRRVAMPVLACSIPSSQCGTIGVRGLLPSTVTACRNLSSASSVVPCIALASTSQSALARKWW